MRRGRCRSLHQATVVAGIAALLATAACGEKKKDAGPPPPPEAGFIVLHAETVPLFIELPGRTSAYETSDVRPQVAGVIQARLFVEGSIVKAGQTLYQIDPSLYRAASASAKASLANAEAARVTAAAKADRYRPLAQLEAVSKQDLSDATAGADQAQASVAQNRAALDTANINLRFTRIAAPISGRIGRSLVTTGALVTTGQTGALAQIQRLDPIFVDIQQSSADLLKLRRALASGGVTPSSAAVRLELEDGSEYGQTGRVEFAEAVVDPASGTVTLRARFANHDGLLLPGMYVRARLSQATARDAILAPQTGISRDPRGAATALVIGAGDKAMLRNVVTTRTVGNAWLVSSGLNAGDRLIVEGLGQIKSGQKVKPVVAGSKPATSPGAANDPAGAAPASKS
ncbi:MAG: efflux RND transporter periplasmic adaptor subunit [Janthinobacterium lividum]